ncbi:oxidoreductase FAD/NAD(P)-binding protein [Xylogone sp. PMI_703]|nr:oxidoreductase FAD/NAD(P)-binding protein [Xylogone sp. PMI_703]
MNSSVKQKFSMYLLNTLAVIFITHILGIRLNSIFIFAIMPRRVHSAHFLQDVPWHRGEEKMHKIMNVSGQMNPASPFLSPGAGYMVRQAPLLALGAVDAQNRPWTSVWGGMQGFAAPVAESTIGISTAVDARYDPVVQTLLGESGDGEVIQPKGKGKMVGGLTIDLEYRSRVKLYGRMKAGVLTADEKNEGVGEAQLLVRIDESLGNCPKYLNKKRIIPSIPTPKLISDSPQLPPQAVSLLEKADLFFISSSNGQKDMDTNHRGGPPGFVRVVSNDKDGAVIVYPEYSGNRLYQTLGNLQTTPLAGLAVPDFDTGDVLYLTGRTEILVNQDAAAVLPRSNLAVKITITSSRFVQTGLPFRGIGGERSPYNPAVRYAATEKITPGTTTGADDHNRAVLVGIKKLTPTISRFRFRIKDPSITSAWKPGQYATLSFEDDLDRGWSHMRDSDPQSLNDDYLRTFTVSNSPSAESIETNKPDEEFELTVRNVGRATSFLSRQKAGYELPLRGFEGQFRLPKKPAGSIIPFIAGGIGITPILGQLSSIDVSQLQLLWTLRLEDIGLVADTLEQHPELIKSTTLFLTGKESDLSDDDRKLLADVIKTGVSIERRRIEKLDIDEIESHKGVDEWYICLGRALKSQVLNWLAGKRVVYEDFSY